MKKLFKKLFGRISINLVGSSLKEGFLPVAIMISYEKDQPIEFAFGVINLGISITVKRRKVKNKLKSLN